jgi:hypothetical protein
MPTIAMLGSAYPFKYGPVSGSYKRVSMLGAEANTESKAQTVFDNIKDIFKIGSDTAVAYWNKKANEATSEAERQYFLSQLAANAPKPASSDTLLPVAIIAGVTVLGVVLLTKKKR